MRQVLRRFRISILPRILVIFLLGPTVMLSQSEPPKNIMMNPMVGTQKILFIIVKYADDSRVVLTPVEAQTHAENLQAIFQANSYDKLNFDIDITPVLEMPQPSSFYDLPNRLSFVRIRADAIKIAEDAGFHEADYDREVIFTTKVWPLVQTGVGGINLRTAFITKNKAALTAHEIGHTFDWRHANFWRVTGGSPIDTAGEKIDYGDRFDIMGDANHFHHFNPFFKYRAGWIPPEHILTVANSGTYTIRPLEYTPQAATPVTEFSALRIRRDPDTAYWLYYRSKEDSANTGALISRMQPTNLSQALLLDMTPGSKGRNQDHSDAALAPGRTIRDTAAGIEITVLDKNNDSLRVQVVVPNTPIDTEPVLDIITPKPGSTNTGAIDYEVTAFDPDFGTTNGAGIDTLTLVLGYLEAPETLLEATAIPVVIKQFSAPPYVLHVDTEQLSDETYWLRVFAKSTDGGTNIISRSHVIDNTGPSTSTAVAEAPATVASEYRLQQNYPNPFNPATTITYTVARAGQVQLRIYDTLGHTVRTLVREYKNAGNHTVIWDGKDENSQVVPSGSYFYEIRVGEFVSTRRMLFVK